jgi:PAS domain S-box-containing protein
MGLVQRISQLKRMTWNIHPRKKQRQKATSELEAMQQELQLHVRLSRSNEKRLATINAICTMLSRSLELEQVLRNALDMVMEVTEVEVALIFSLDKRAQELTIMAYEGVSDEFAQDVDRMKLGEGFNGQVALTGEPLVVEDASHDPRLTREMVRREKIEAQLIVALRARGAIVGTLCVANRRPRQFLPEEIDLLTAIGCQIGIAIENAQFYQEQQRMAKQYREIFENANDAIWVHDLEGNILAANEAMARLTGYSKEELVHMNVTRFLSEEGLSLAGEIRRRLLQGEVIDKPYDQRLIRKEGTEVLLKLNSSLVSSDGKPIGIQHIARDVTEERRAQENLRFYVQEITRAQEEERKRIARELHDETAQRLIALSHHLEDFARSNEHLPTGEIERLNNLREQVKDALQGVKHFSRDLRPSVLDDLGLLPALEWLTNDLKEQSGIKAGLKIIGAQRRLAPEAELLLFRIVQEAVNNARRHAEASEVQVTIEFDEGKTSAIISDNGRGFEVPKTLGELSRIGKLGLIGMEERVQLLDGSLMVQSEPRKGTTVVIETRL